MNILYHHRTQGRRVERVHILGLADALRELGHTVAIVSPPGVDLDETAGSASPEQGRARSGRRSRWAWASQRLPQVCFEGLELAYNAAGRRRLDKRLGQGSWDCLYERYALNTWAGAAAAAAAGIPLILEINDATGIQRERVHRLNRIAAAVERRVWSSAAFLITISSAFARILASRGVPPEKIAVLPNAVDPRRFAAAPGEGEAVRRRLGLADSVVLGFAGSFAAWHGIGRFLDQLPELLAGRPELMVVMIGDGKCRGDAEAQVAAAGLLPQVRFTGWIPHQALPAYLSAIDIGIIPDSNEYGSPMKLFEYMAMAAVPVVPDYPPMRDVIVQGQHGLLFPRGDMRAMRNAIAQLVDQPGLRKTMGEAARANVLAGHTWEANAKRVEELISRAKAGRRE